MMEEQGAGAEASGIATGSSAEMFELFLTMQK
jgi:hypothetical protein